MAREEIEPPDEPRHEPEERPASKNLSGSGTGTGGSDDEPGQAQSGTGTAQTAPPPPPPPASGRGLHGEEFPPIKNAEHDGVEGVVFLVIEVSADGQLLNVILERSSGDSRLDTQALKYVQDMWTFPSPPMTTAWKLPLFSARGQRFVSSGNTERSAG